MERLIEITRAKSKFTVLLLVVGFMQGSYLFSKKSFGSTFGGMRSLQADNGELIAHETPAEGENEESHKSFTLLLMLALEVFAFLTAYILKKTHFKYLQEAGATMLFGSLVGIFTHFLHTETAA